MDIKTSTSLSDARLTEIKAEAAKLTYEPTKRAAAELIAEIERLRQPVEPPVIDPDLNPALFVPGSFGCHEAMHMAMVLAEQVEERLCDHPSIRMTPEWASMADRAQALLADLYQKIGAEHMQDLSNG